MSAPEKPRRARPTYFRLTPESKLALARIVAELKARGLPATNERYVAAMAEYFAAVGADRAAELLGPLLERHGSPAQGAGGAAVEVEVEVDSHPPPRTVKGRSRTA